MPTALITGASRGIGRAIALLLAPRFDIVATARSQQGLDELAAEIAANGGRCQTLPLDLRSAEEIALRIGGLDVDVLVNNAGIMHKKPLYELSSQEWHEMVDVNFNALYHTTRAVLPAMFARGAGHIINIASIAGRSAFIGGSGYGATKHAVLGFSESLMLEVRDRGVRISVVMPGSVATDMMGAAVADWMLRPEDVAAAVDAIVSMPSHALIYQVEVRASRPQKG